MPQLQENMFSLSEMVGHEQIAKNLTFTESWMDGSKNGFHPEDANLFHDLKPAEKWKAQNTIKEIDLGRLLKEYMDGTAATTGSYLIPTKIHDVLYTAASAYDIAPHASPIVSAPGSSLKVDIEVDDVYVANRFSSGGKLPDENMKLVQPTATPVSFGINAAITNDLIEDSQFDMVAQHLQRGAKQMGEFSTHIWLADLILGADGDGTQNALTTGATTVTDLGDLADAWALNAADGFISDVAIIGPGPVSDILQDDSVSKYSDLFHSKWSLGAPIASTDDPMYFGDFLGMKTFVIPEQRTTGDGAMYLSSKWHSFVLNKENAMLTVRKRWLKMEDYSDPVRDLVGVVISGRQDQISVYNDASCEITEK